MVIFPSFPFSEEPVLSWSVAVRLAAPWSGSSCGGQWQGRHEDYSKMEQMVFSKERSTTNWSNYLDIPYPIWNNIFQRARQFALGWIITQWSWKAPAMFLSPGHSCLGGNSPPKTVLIKWVDENKKKTSKTPFTHIIQHLSSQLLSISRLQKPPGSNVAVWDPPRWTWALVLDVN